MEQDVKDFFQVEPIDKIFALVYFLVGYGLVYVFTSSEFGRDLAIYTVLYGVVVLLYCGKKKISLSKESCFWLIVMLAIGIPYGFWSVFPVLQVLALIFVAAYWTISISKRFLLEGKTSQYIFFDGLNALCIIPLGNMDSQFRTLFAKDKTEEKKKDNVVLSVFIGLAITVPVLLIILPLLSRADAGFEKMLSEIWNYIVDHLLLTFVRIIFAIPVACYLYGLLFGTAKGRNTDCIKTEILSQAGRGMRIIPNIATSTAMIVICFVYVLFIGLQGNYMFSAFTGNLPEEFTYAEYARRGFFELCSISTLNLMFAGFFEMFSKKGRKENKGLRILVISLSILTLLIIATAMSKMGMYIVVYGLTVKRVLTMVFMMWLMIVFIGKIIQQKKEIPLTRVCVMIGAVLFVLLCVLPVENWIDLYNQMFVG